MAAVCTGKCAAFTPCTGLIAKARGVDAAKVGQALKAVCNILTDVPPKGEYKEVALTGCAAKTFGPVFENMFRIQTEGVK